MLIQKEVRQKMKWAVHEHRETINEEYDSEYWVKKLNTNILQFKLV